MHKHNRCFLSSKYRTKPLTTKISLEDRPKWGINRPSVQYKKQSEKDPYYQKKLKEKLKNTTEPNTPEQTIKSEEGADKREEKELDSVVRLLELRTDDRDKADEDEKTEIILENGFRMNSNLSSPVFVPIDNRIKPDWNKLKELELGSEKSFDVIKFAVQEQEDTTETEEEKTVISGSERFLTHMKLEAIEKITTLREVF